MALPPVKRFSRPRLIPIRPGKVVKLVLLCLLVGLILSALDIGPLEFWSWVAGLATGFYDWLVRVFGDLGTYVVIGAAVVIPIWVARAIYLRFQR